MIDVDITYLTIVASVILPIIVGLITKRVASSGLKALMLVLLAVIASLIQQLIDAGGQMELEPFVTGAFVQFLMAVGVHYGLTKPLGVTGTNGVVQQKVTGGIGGTVSASDPNSTGV